MQSVPITTNIVSSNFVQTRCTRYNIVIKFVSDLWQVIFLLWVLQFHPPIKLTWHYDITVILLKVVLNTKTPTSYP